MLLNKSNEGVIFFHLHKECAGGGTRTPKPRGTRS